MVMRAIFSGSQQIFEEVCEHCGEKVRDIHVSDITVKADNDPRSITIKDKDDNNVTTKKITDKIIEVSESYKRRGLLDTSEATAAFSARGFKYGVRPEAMCSASIDLINDVTQSFCYRVAATPNAAFATKIVGGRTLSASLATAELTDSTGSRMGVDRKGNVIKMSSYKRVAMDTGIAEAASAVKYKGPFLTAWFRALRSTDQKYLITGAQAISGYVIRYGALVKTMEVVARYRNRAAFITDVNRNGGRLE